MVFQNTNVSRKFFRLIAQEGGGATKSISEYYRKCSLPCVLPVVMVVTKEVPVLVGLVLGLHHRVSHTLGSRLGGRTPKGLK
jgi:hypothetical protein